MTGQVSTLIIKVSRYSICIKQNVCIYIGLLSTMWGVFFHFNAIRHLAAESENKLLVPG